MKTSTILIITIALTLFVSVFIIWIIPSRQDFIDSNVSWNGLSDWLNNNPNNPVDENRSLATLAGDMQGQVLVCIPNTPYQESEKVDIKNFVSQGGNLVILNDYGYGNDILAYLNVSARFSGRTVLDPLFCYKSPALPRITDFSPGLRGKGIKSVVLNHATSISGVSNADVLAWSSQSSFLDYNNDGMYDSGEGQGPFPVAARFILDKGTIVLFTDPSILINSMLPLEDNGAMVQSLIQPPGEQPYKLILDAAHLELTTLDASKVGLTMIRQFLKTPYPLLCIVAIIFILVYRYGFRKGELLG